MGCKTLLWKVWAESGTVPSNQLLSNEISKTADQIV